MNERDWQLLSTLFEQGNITKTAAALYITQPALSTRLQNIEALFDAKIVIRGKKGVQFTPEGEFLARKARAILNEYNEMHDTIASMKSAPSGVLRIAASHFFTKFILPKLLKRFKELHPKIEYRVQTGWSRDMVQLVLNNDAHIGFIRGEYSWQGIRRLLFKEQMCVAYHQRFSVKRLPELPLIQYRNDPTNQSLIDRWWADRFTVPPLVGMTVDRVDTCKEMVKMGLGYGFLPSTILRDESALHQKTMTDVSGAAMDRNTWLILKTETAELQLVSAFISMLDTVNFADLRYT